MPIVDTIRTVRRTETKREKIDAKPEFKKGDYVEVCYGPWEGHHFWINAVRYNHDLRRFEYYRDNIMFEHWYGEDALVRG